MRRAAVATWALAARVNLWTVRPASIPAAARFPRPPRIFPELCSDAAFTHKTSYRRRALRRSQQLVRLSTSPRKATRVSRHSSLPAEQKVNEIFGTDDNDSALLLTRHACKGAVRQLSLGTSKTVVRWSSR